MTGKNRMIFDPKDDGTYGGRDRRRGLAISIPRSEAAVIRHLPETTAHGLFVPEVPSQ